MCWVNYMATPIVLKKPLRVYKVGILAPFDNFISLFRDYMYHKCQTMPTVEIDPEFNRFHTAAGLFDPAWYYDHFHIHKGYHSYLTKEIAKRGRNPYEEIGIFEIPAGATVYINYRYKEVVSTNIKYLGSLEE